MARHSAPDLTQAGLSGPLPGRRRRPDGRSVGTITQSVRDILCSRGGCCTLDELRAAVAADPIAFHPFRLLKVTSAAMSGNDPKRHSRKAAGSPRRPARSPSCGEEPRQ